MVGALFMTSLPVGASLLHEFVGVEIDDEVAGWNGFFGYTSMLMRLACCSWRVIAADSSHHLASLVSPLLFSSSSLPSFRLHASMSLPLSMLVRELLSDEDAFNAFHRSAAVRICGENLWWDAHAKRCICKQYTWRLTSLLGRLPCFFRHSTISMLLEGLTAAIFIKALFFTLPGKLIDLVPSPLIAPMGAFDARYWLSARAKVYVRHEEKCAEAKPIWKRLTVVFQRHAAHLAPVDSTVLDRLSSSTPTERWNLMKKLPYQQDSTIECSSLSKSLPSKSIIEASCIEHGRWCAWSWCLGGGESEPIEDRSFQTTIAQIRIS